MTKFPSLVVVLSVALSAGLAAAISLGASAPLADSDSPERPAITKSAEGFVEAFRKGDAAAVSAFWTPDGDYVDQSGRALKGRAAIAEEFRQFFAANPGVTLRIEVGSVRFPTADTAVEDGVTSVMFPDGSPPSRARYTNLHVKQGGQWLLASVREAPYVPPSHLEHLRQLDWAIGEWIDADAKGGHVGHVTFEWTPDDNFIVSTRTVEVNGVFLPNGTQRIGWDPAAKRVRSWSFESDGGFGESAWTKSETGWVIKSSAVLQSGSLVTATNIVTQVDANTITWQAKEQLLDGKAMPDTPVTTMKRIR